MSVDEQSSDTLAISKDYRIRVNYSPSHVGKGSGVRSVRGPLPSFGHPLRHGEGLIHLFYPVKYRTGFGADVLPSVGLWDRSNLFDDTWMRRLYPDLCIPITISPYR
ncbi:MAG: hypothetical protein ACYC27_07095 [Armatimonadota bacterium]